MAASRALPNRVYASREQVVIGWLGVVLMLGLSVVAVLQPTARGHGGYVIAGVGLVLAVGGVRFARSGVYVSAGGVRVRNVLSTTDLAWEEIREFKLSPVGASLVGLKDGRWVGITGIEQTNWAFMTKRQNTPERRMIAELNELLREHGGPSSASQAARSRRGSARAWRLVRPGTACGRVGSTACRLRRP